MKSPFAFKKYGQCGMDVSELWPKLAEVVDDICWVRSVYTEIPNHEPSCLMMNTGANQAGRPSLGAWMTYGLGTENANLPGYVVLCPDVPTTVGPPLWGNGFLPAINQGTFISNKVAGRFSRRPSADAGNGRRPTRRQSRRKSSSRRTSIRRSSSASSTIRSSISPNSDASSTCCRSSSACAALAPSRIRKSKRRSSRWKSPTACRPKLRKSSTSARNRRRRSISTVLATSLEDALMAVRLAEKGVRMTQVYYAKGDPWDAHGDIMAHKVNAKNSDQAFAAVIKDLKQRGLWKDTLVVCGSEFGRTPVREVGGGGGNVKRGRDHNPFGFTMWLAGGAVKGGTIYGATDDFGFKAVEKPVHVHDIHATILYLLGIDHTKLTYRYSGRDFRLTDVHGNVLHDLIA